MDSTPLEGKVALVTGAGRNLGRAIALALSDAGAKVAVNVRVSRDEGQAVVDEIAARGGHALLVVADVAERAEVDAMIGSISKHFGRLDIVVNNAAIRHEVAFADLSYADWRATQAVCVDGAFHCTQAALPLLRGSGAGTVINISGLTAQTGAAKRAHVVTAKAALGGLTRALAHELAEFGITVNCVSPGMVDTGAQGLKRNGEARASRPSQSLARATWASRRNRERRRVAGRSRRALHYRPDLAHQRRRLPERLIMAIVSRASSSARAATAEHA